LLLVLLNISVRRELD